jgi:hypothetical protein
LRFSRLVIRCPEKGGRGNQEPSANGGEMFHLQSLHRVGYIIRQTECDGKRGFRVVCETVPFPKSDTFREKAIAALNHPHICTLYDVGPDGQRVLALLPPEGEMEGSELTVLTNWRHGLK